ncbi:hypothetical protein [Hyalangium gracile]|uniref:hypothetical protein n=1 Tax=Hyalangium gracile TaxID=394092 RepID=UPI001CCC2842|nr:hypothetical protein [Hyalangium gracile]
MSSFSTQGLVAILAGPVQRVLRDVQVLGLEAAATEAPTSASPAEGRGTEEVRAQPPVMDAPAGVIRGVRAVVSSSPPSAMPGAPTEAEASASRVPGQMRAERTEGPGLPRGMAGASEPSPATSTVPRLVLRRDRPGAPAHRAPARVAPTAPSPTAAPSDVPAGMEERELPLFSMSRPEAGAVPGAPRLPSEASVQSEAPPPVSASAVRMSRPEAVAVPVASRVPSEALAQSEAQASVASSPVQPGASAPVSSATPQVPASVGPATTGLPRLVLRRAPASPRDSRPVAETAAAPRTQVSAPEPLRAPEGVPLAASEVRGSLPPSAPHHARPESPVARGASGEGIPLMSRGPRWMTRDTAESESPERVGQPVPVLERSSSSPAVPGPALLQYFAPEPSGAAFPPSRGAAPAAPSLPELAAPPESLLRNEDPFAPPAAQALPLDREQLEELLVDILETAARGEGVEV